MEKLKKWFSTKNGKIITGVVVVALILSGITIARLLQNKSIKYTLEARGVDEPAIVLEYGVSVKTEDITARYVVKANGEDVDNTNFTITMDPVKTDKVTYKMTEEQRIALCND
ncbi:hypothetical protein MGH68_18805 [Erysipelothrix sp. D19-032]